MQASPAAIDMIKKIISFNTISSRSNLPLIEYVKGLMDEHGIPYRLSYDETGEKANLFATIGPDIAGGVVLSGHVDVVPVEGQEWSNDPFDAVVRDGAIYGRGTVDMKGFVAIVLSQVPNFVKANLKRPIHIALTYDEEVGCKGVRVLMDDLAKRPHKPMGCILGEATAMRMVGGHKGKYDMGCRITGKEGHSSIRDQYVNALEAGAEIVHYLKTLNERNKKQGPFDDSYDPNYSTVHTGVFKSGTALNIVPNKAEMEFEFRCIPAQDPLALMSEVEQFVEQSILPMMHKVSADTKVEFIPGVNMKPMDTPREAEIFQLVQDLTGEKDVYYFSGGTEGGDYNAAGIPTVIIGPGDGLQCHQPDEHLMLDQVAACEEFLTKLTKRLSEY